MHLHFGGWQSFKLKKYAPKIQGNSQENIKSVYCHPAYLTEYAEYIMQNARMDEAQAGIKIDGRNINNLRSAMIATLWQKQKRNERDS